MRKDELKEELKQREIARNLKALGLDVASICQVTGLTPEETENL